jgi:purine-nucleoside phosphorylase
MQKQYVGMGVLVLVVIAAGWYFVSLNEPKAAPVVTPAPATTTSTTTTEVATGTTSAPTTPDEIELDLTKLQGKDRLYTEEEGKYENLSEEERKMVSMEYYGFITLKQHNNLRAIVILELSLLVRII